MKATCWICASLWCVWMWRCYWLWTDQGWVTGHSGHVTKPWQKFRVGMWEENGWVKGLESPILAEEPPQRNHKHEVVWLLADSYTGLGFSLETPKDLMVKLNWRRRTEWLSLGEKHILLYFFLVIWSLSSSSRSFHFHWVTLFFLRNDV